MNVAGIDYSTHAVDLVLIPYDYPERETAPSGTASRVATKAGHFYPPVPTLSRVRPPAEYSTTPPQWHRFPLTGTDAFDRTRSVADAMPGRHSIFWDEILAVGIEHPGGHHGTRDMLRVQGAILSMLPPRLLVQPWPPARWRKAVGLPGNASKDDIRDHVLAQFGPIAPLVIYQYPQDACDAYCLALATRDAIRTEQAA